VAELPAELRVLVTPLEQIRELTGHMFPPTFVAALNRAGDAWVPAPNLAPEYMAEALHELVTKKLRPGRLAEDATGAARRRYKPGDVGALILRYLGGKRTWLDKAGEPAAGADDTSSADDTGSSDDIFADDVDVDAPEVSPERATLPSDVEAAQPPTPRFPDLYYAIMFELSMSPLPARRADLEKQRDELVAQVGDTGPP
jgi:hypothetical protein